jgi:hypothetical protein
MLLAEVEDLKNCSSHGSWQWSTFQLIHNKVEFIHGEVFLSILIQIYTIFIHSQ